MICPSCKSVDFRRNGFVRGKQRFRCSICSCNFTINDSRSYPEFLKFIASFFVLNTGYVSRDGEAHVWPRHNTWHIHRVFNISRSLIEHWTAGPNYVNHGVKDIENVSSDPIEGLIVITFRTFKIIIAQKTDRRFKSYL
jgi:hypothetical protein